MQSRHTELERVEIIKKHLDEYKKNNESRTLSVDIRGERKDLPVIRLNTSVLLFNPSNHRLTAQMDAHPLKEKIASHPDSVEAQAAICQLLASTKSFKQLKDQLKELKQKEPGLITREGLLVNGNTRLAAILELKKEGNMEDGFDVAVLPPALTEQDKFQIETDLQLKKLVHQDYTFTNNLLMMKNHRNQKASYEEIAKRMGKRRGKKKVEQALRTLDVIEEIRSISNPTYPYEAFDNDEEKFKNLDDAYQLLLSQGDTRGAESVKWSRIAAIILRLSKDHVRAIDEDFFQSEIIDRRLENSEENIKLKSYLESFKNEAITDNSDGLFDEEQHEENYGDHTKKLVKDILCSDQVRNEQGVIKKDLIDNFGALANRLKVAARAKITRENEKSEGQKPLDILQEITISLSGLHIKIPELIDHPEFNGDDFRDELEKIQEIASEIQALQRRNTLN